MRYSAALALVALLAAVTPSWAVNEDTTLPLHVVPTFPAFCTSPGDPCADGTINLDTSTADLFPTVFLLMRNHEIVLIVQTAFEWTGFTMVGQEWFCQSNQLAVSVPDPTSTGGPIDGTMATVFDPIVGPKTAVIGYMLFLPGTPGSCVRQVESGFELGTHVRSELFIITPVAPENRGSVCAGPGGVDTCEPAVTPVEATTWGNIKGQYRQHAE